jgi:hypothetical protein
MAKNNSRAFGGNRKGPGYRTPSSFRAQVSPQRTSKHQIDIKAPRFNRKTPR